jgi:HIV Tat-specific factor 1
VQRHPDGVVMVTFSAPEEADSCVATVNGRWFAGCQLEATSWDGRTKYQVQETQEEMEKRLSSWHTYLESDSHSKEDQTSASISSVAASADAPSETTPSSEVDDPQKPESAAGSELETVVVESRD